MINTTLAATTKLAGEPEPEADVSQSRIDGHSHFNGLYETRHNLRIEGVAEGEIRCEGMLTVVEGARVKAKVSASAISIAGELEGDVVCQGAFEITPTGQVQATVKARRLIVQEGGLFNGEFAMITDAAVPLRREILRSDSAAHEDAGDEAPGDEAGPSTLLSSDEWWSKMLGAEPSKDDSAGPPS